MARAWSGLLEKSSASCAVAHDPVGAKLGSGGGTVHLIREAWRQEGTADFAAWREREKRLILHAGGQSRRLPAYAPSGKSLIPIPVFRWSRGQRIDQSLLDLQLELPARLLATAPSTLRWLIVSGDVLIRCEEELPELPGVDVACLGLWAHPEQAARHGVFFLPRQAPDQLDFVLQKPPLQRIHELVETHLFLLDIGLWVLSDRAMELLFRLAGCDPATGQTSGSHPSNFDLYGTFGPALGKNPSTPQAEISRLSSAVLPLPGGEFFHFGSNRELIASSLALQNRTLDQRRIFGGWVKPHPSIFVQNARTNLAFESGHQTIWIENSVIGARWKLSHDHILTGVPDNDWALHLGPGQCLDFVPVEGGLTAVRPYGMEDSFQGGLGGAVWLGQPFRQWAERRGLDWGVLGWEEETDLQLARIFPAWPEAEIDPELVQWMLAESPAPDTSPDSPRARYENAPRFSAEELSARADLPGLFASRQKHLDDSLPALARHASRSVFYQVDLRHLAGRYARAGHPLPPLPAGNPSEGLAGLGPVHDRMFRAMVLEERGEDPRPMENEAFTILRQAVLSRHLELPNRPRPTLLPDQILWGRSPVRLDLAGGWTDTPPYCFLQGGRVLNVAVELNGQPPIQVFARLTDEPILRIRSIDLGQSQTLQTFAEVATYAEMGSGFAIAKAALALCGFHPDFCAGRPFHELSDQLREFGGGIELSLLAAVPKGSGLGTSSILAATLLGVLNELCGHGWDINGVASRTLALEQMLTSGGGWQDQFGGLLPGLKLLETRPGLEQIPRVRWLPDRLLTDPAFHTNLLLYYTGITRQAKGILAGIVRGMFLNARPELPLLEEIGRNASVCADALETSSWTAFCRTLRRSWELNQALDAGTCPPELAALLPRLEPHLGGLKLLGAGGGGYLLMAARSVADAREIRELLAAFPTGPGARLVDFAVSRTGFQISRS